MVDKTINWEYRYDYTLKLNFNFEVDNRKEEIINNTILETLGSKVEIDWRNSKEIEVHNITKKDFDNERDLTELILSRL
jgi:hypothetical protein